ncbi:MAG: hypothetical protein ACXAC7_03695 [Candidatus Hodarchaeales archaeon]
MYFKEAIDEVKPGALVSGLWNLVANYLNLIYDPLSAILYHGLRIVQYVPVPAMPFVLLAYVLFAELSIYATASSIIVEFIVGLVEG